MTVLNSGISWCTGTLNLTVGCDKVSPGCDFCYAEALVHKLSKTFGPEPFSTLRFHPQRLRDLRKFKPFLGPDGLLCPALVFVNSLSDFFHPGIPDDFIHTALDTFEEHPTTILQILTKRPVRAREVIVQRYKGRGVPDNLWFGTSVEDDRVAGRLNIMRKAKDRVGGFTLFVSIEPLIGPLDRVDLTDVDWVLTGGESGNHCRDMDFGWLVMAHMKTRLAGGALHFKQFGHPRNNPLVQEAMRHGRMSATAAFDWVCKRGLELAPEEKGGATYNGAIIREKPAAYDRVKAKLNLQPARLL